MEWATTAQDASDEIYLRPIRRHSHRPAMRTNHEEIYLHNFYEAYKKEHSPSRNEHQTHVSLPPQMK